MFFKKKKKKGLGDLTREILKHQNEKILQDKIHSLNSLDTRELIYNVLSSGLQEASRAQKGELCLIKGCSMHDPPAGKEPL
jgi:hypothetical protein